MPIIYGQYQIPLEDNVTLWRYMDFDKFESLMNRKALFFCRDDKFSDPFEGSSPKKEVNYRIVSAKRASNIYGIPFNEEKAKNEIQNVSESQKRFKRTFVINCWHINNVESDAMWRLYLKDNEGVAIQTNSKRIKEVCNQVKENIGISKIRYLDYENEGWYHPTEYPHQYSNVYAPFVHKRKEFKHESEFRIYHIIEEAKNDENFWDHQENSKGMFINVNISLLIEKIIFPPTSDSKIEEKIIALTKKYGFDFEFHKSKLQNDPYF